MRFLFYLLVGLLCAVCVASAVAAEPADAWLDRAQTDIAALPAKLPEKDYFILAPNFLAVQLCFTAPSDARRAFAVRLVEREINAEIDKHQSAEQTRGSYLAGAGIEATLGDLDGARKYLALADAPTKAAPTTDPMVQFASATGMGETFRAEAYLILGDRKAFDKIDLTPFGCSSVIDALRVSGHSDLVRTVLKKEQRKVESDVLHPPNEYVSPGLERIDVIRALARNGDWDQAIKAAANVEVGLSDHERLYAGYHAIQANAALAGISLEKEKPAFYQQAMTAAVEILHNNPDQEGYDLQQLLALAVMGRDSQHFHEFCTLLQARLDHQRKQYGFDPTWHASALADLAGLCVLMTENNLYQQVIDEAEADLKLPDGYLSDDQLKRRKEQRATEYLHLAATRAKQRDWAGMQQDIDQSKKTAALDADHWDRYWVEIGESYADAGMFGKAIAAAAETKESGADILYHVALRESQLGKFADAWKIAFDLPVRVRIRLQYVLAVSEIRPNKEKDLYVRMPYIQSSPYEEALIHLAAAQALLHREYQGDFHEWRPREVLCSY